MQIDAAGAVQPQVAFRGHREVLLCGEHGHRLAGDCVRRLPIDDGVLHRCALRWHVHQARSP
jgi:hypothetical protein